MDDSPAKQMFLVAHDYGMGGIWTLIKARSKEEVLAKFKEIVIVDDRPHWMTDDFYSQMEVRAFDVEAPAPEWLGLLR